MSKPRLQRKKYLVGLVDGDQVVEHEIEVSPTDVFVAEKEAGTHSIDMDKQRLGFATLMIWFAAKRLGIYSHSFNAFLADCYEWEPIKAEDGGESDVDPTRPEVSTDSDSPSPSTTAPPSTGSTPPPPTS